MDFSETLRDLARLGSILLLLKYGLIIGNVILPKLGYCVQMAAQI